MIVTTNPDYIEPASGPTKKKRTNISAILFEQIIEKYDKEIDDGSFISPLSYWLSILNDEDRSTEERDRAAALSAKYVHRAMPTETEIKQEITSPSFQISFIGQDAAE